MHRTGCAIDPSYMTTTTPSRPAIAGNRLVLVGAILYLLEWVAIIGAGFDAPLGPGASTTDLLAAYHGHAEAYGWAAGWFGVVEIGRLLVMVGLAAALDPSGRRSALMQVAIVAMAVSCALEVASYAVVAATAAASTDASAAVVRTLDLVAYDLNLLLAGPFGISLLCAGVAMWRSDLFSKVLPVLPLVSGAAFCVLGVAFSSPSHHGLADGLTSAGLLFWVWIVWTGVILWRRTGWTGAEPPVAESELAHA